MIPSTTSTCSVDTLASVLQTLDVLDVSILIISIRGSILIPVVNGRVTVSGQRAFMYGVLFSAQILGTVDFRIRRPRGGWAMRGTDLGVS